MIYFFIGILIVVLLICLKKNVENFFLEDCEPPPKNKWWDWNKNKVDSENKLTIKKNELNVVIKKCQKPNHYIETADDDFSNYKNIQINYRNNDNRNIASKFGKKDGSDIKKIKTLINEPIITTTNIINQGKNIKQKIELGKDKGNPKDSVNYFAKIEDLDSFYKYQILKKKNYTNYLEGEDEYTDYSNFDTRYVDKSTGIDTNGDTLPNREESVDLIFFKEKQTI